MPTCCSPRTGWTSRTKRWNCGRRSPASPKRRADAGDVSELEAAAPADRRVAGPRGSHRHGRRCGDGAARLVTLMGLPGMGLDVYAVGETPSELARSHRGGSARRSQCRPPGPAGRGTGRGRRGGTLGLGPQAVDSGRRRDRLQRTRFRDSVPASGSRCRSSTRNRGLIAVAQGESRRRRGPLLHAVGSGAGDVLTARVRLEQAGRTSPRSNRTRCRRPGKPPRWPGRTSRAAACRTCSRCKRWGNTSAPGSGPRTRPPKPAGRGRSWNGRSVTDSLYLRSRS